jgi:hypothetical protein
VVVAAEEEIDPVIAYYWDHARTAAPVFNPNVPGVSYSYKAKTYRFSVTSEGLVRKTDSLEQVCYYRDGKLDSVHLVRGKVNRFKNLDLSFPDVFANRYHLNFYPNDRRPGWRSGFTNVGDSLTGRCRDRNDISYSLYCIIRRSGFRRFALVHVLLWTIWSFPIRFGRWPRGWDFLHRKLSPGDGDK